MHTRYMERSSSMAREKRALDSMDAIEGQPESKRPALASVIVEALKMDSLQRLCSSLEPIFRKIVSEEVERALAKIGPSQLCGRSSPKQLEGVNTRNLKLQFKTRLSLPLFTGGKVDGEQGASIHIVLVDATNGQIVTSGPESSAKLDVVVLEGDFNNEDDEDWSEEEFECRVVKEREGKRPLLTGDLQVCLKEGVGTLGDLTFTDNSSWIRSRRFRLGLKVATGYCEGIRIREAKTEDFIVKDHRGELYKKHYPPALNDEVWRLEKIGKEGAFHKRLNKAGIVTVEDFLRLVVRDSQRLRNILGSGMSNKMWEALVEHANSCVLNGKVYVYYSDDSRNVGVVFNNIYELSGLIANGNYSSLDSLSDCEKVYVDNLVKKAYEDWMHVIEYDSKSLLCLHDNPNSFNHQFVLPEQPSIPSGLAFGEGDNGRLHEPHGVNEYASTITTTTATSLPLQTHLYESHQQLNFSNMIGASNNPPSYKVAADEYFPEDEIRTRSHEMLENEDMQHLLRWFNAGSMNASHEDGDPGMPYSSSYLTPGAPTQSPLSYAAAFIGSKTHSSGRAVVGWLKLKAALRWGIFVRKKAAEKRAQLVELDESP